MALDIRPMRFAPAPRMPAAVAYFGAVGVDDPALTDVVKTRVPILPVASSTDLVSSEIPRALSSLNALSYGEGPERVTSALLECLGLLPRQRRVFVSYRRSEARGAALQLFETFSARQFDVFLDTHGIPPADDFQAVLWHRLCDSDVLVMLDTPTYFESRWTSAEYGRALAKGISVLSIGWPGVTASPRTSTASRIMLEPSDLDPATCQLSNASLSRICGQLESVRSQSQAVRHLNLVSNISQAIGCIGGTISGVGLHNTIYATLPDGMELAIYPAVGVPTSMTLNDAVSHLPDRNTAVVFDHIGLHEPWLRHLAWLGEHIHATRWVKVAEAAWTFAGWGV